MPGLKEVRIRIASVKSTQQITSAMKMVSAAKFKKAQTAVIKLRLYAAKLHQILTNLSLSLGSSPEGKYSDEREVKKILLVVVASNKGLCGAFNSNILKAANRLIEDQYKIYLQKDNLHLITIGRKSTDFFKKRKYNVIESYDSIWDKLNFENSSAIAEKLMKLFNDKTYDKIILIYNYFKNAAVQIQTIEQFLPVKPSTDDKQGKAINPPDYIFEPNKEVIVQELIPKSLKIQFYKALLDSFAAEHGARMTAMHMATDNAGEMIKSLTLSYNKARQAAITKELLEIVSGAEALKG